MATYDELFALSMHERPAEAFRAALDRGALEPVLPELADLRGVTQSAPHVYDVWNHTLAVVEGVAAVMDALAGRSTPSAGSTIAVVVRHLAPVAPELVRRTERELVSGRPVRGLVVLSALLHDVAKPQTRTVGKDGRIHFYRHDEVGAGVTERRLASAPLTAEEVELVRASVFHHLRPAMLARSSPTLPKRVVGKYRRDLGELGAEVCLLAIGDRLGKGGTEDLESLGAYVDQCVQLVTACLHEPQSEAPPPEPLLRGSDIIALGAPEGPAVGAILKAIEDAHERGDIEDKDAALALAAQLIASRS